MFSGALAKQETNIEYWIGTIKNLPPTKVDEGK